MARFQTLLCSVLALALILSGTHTVLGQPSTISPPNQATAPVPITGPYRLIVVDPSPSAVETPGDLQLFGHSLRQLLQAARNDGRALVDFSWPERCNALARPGTNMTWSIYSLSELGQDAEQGKWLAETITQVVQPQSWTTVNGQEARITYHPRGKVLIVYNTPAVQEEVNAFLGKLRQAMSQENAGSVAASTVGNKTIVPISYTSLPSDITASAGSKAWVVPHGGNRSGDACAPYHSQGPVAYPPFKYGEPGAGYFANHHTGYPVPSVPQPKHLFHFIIRYEGEGIVDSNVVDLVKVMYGPETKAKAEKDAAAKDPAQPTTSKGETEKEKAKVNWRTDYNAARQEAKEKKLPIFIIFCKDDCSVCVKMDRTTFQDALIIGLLNDKFMPVKMSGDSDLATALKVESYPSYVFADSDGKLLQRQPLVGYKDATAFFEQVFQALDQRRLPDLPVKNEAAVPLPPPPAGALLQPVPQLPIWSPAAPKVKAEDDE